MNAQTIEALKASIAKWERNAEAKTPTKYKISEYDCPLCSLFISKDCVGCPVSERSGKALCYGTPYRPAMHAWFDWSDGTTDAGLCHAAARDEVAFLKSLLPVQP